MITSVLSTHTHTKEKHTHTIPAYFFSVLSSFQTPQLKSLFIYLKKKITKKKRKKKKRNKALSLSLSISLKASSRFWSSLQRRPASEISPVSGRNFRLCDKNIWISGLKWFHPRERFAFFPFFWIINCELWLLLILEV